MHTTEEGNAFVANNIKAAAKAVEKVQKKAPTMGTSIAKYKKDKAVWQAELDQAQNALDYWNGVKDAQEAEVKRVNDAQRAERLKAEEEAARLAALEGAPEWNEDRPQDARARGFRRSIGYRYDRQGEVDAAEGKEVNVKFADNVKQSGHVAVMEVGDLQPSHFRGQRNPMHFLDEAQPKERKGMDSVWAAEKIAGNINPEEITSSVTAYTGAPSVNRRGETIQGNNRAAALKEMWEQFPEQAAKYKQYLVDHAEDFGLDAEVISNMENPV